MNNIVFIPNVNLGNGRSDSYKYSIQSWKNWGEKNNVQVFEWTEPITDPSLMKITLQRYWVHDILQHNDIEYDQVLIVDADTIIHPNSPNFFDITEGKFSTVLNNGCYEWVTRSIKNWGEALFEQDERPSPWEYFNGGFQITSKEHIPFYDYVKDFYQTNAGTIKILADKIKAGTDQTVVNYLAKKFGVETKFLPEAYNLQDLFRKNLLHIPGHSWFKDELLFLDAGWVYHFNAIPQNPRHVDYWMERTYKQLYGEL
jgi:lipopolysaccharide biosynthesis glycosyltransferase